MNELPVRIERTRNRNSRAVLTDEGITIRLAGRMPRWLEEEHIRSLTRRMQEAAKRHLQKILIHPFRSVLAGAPISFVTLGDGRTIAIERKEGKRTRLSMDGDRWTLSVGPATDKPALHRLLWRALSSWALPSLEREVHAVNAETFGFRVRDVLLRYTRSQWGSCSPDGRIALSAALLFVPERARRSVIIHELAHIRYRSHGKRFWDLVASVMPDIDDATKTLRGFRIVRTLQRTTR